MQIVRVFSTYVSSCVILTTLLKTANAFHSYRNLYTYRSSTIYTSVIAIYLPSILVTGMQWKCRIRTNAIVCCLPSCVFLLMPNTCVCVCAYIYFCAIFSFSVTTYIVYVFVFILIHIDHMLLPLILVGIVLCISFSV